MTLHLWLQNLAAYSAQIAVIVAAGAALPCLFRVRRPDAMLMYRQMLLVACLLLPALQPWKQQPVVETSSEGVSIGMTPVHIVPIPARGLSVEQAIALLLAAGIFGRLAWLAIGLRRLRRHRRQAGLLDPPPARFGGMASCLGVNPSFCLSTGVSGPVTFGVRNPVILLPSQFLQMPSGAQEAIVCHELVHIRRRDWAFTMAEELIRAVFWFHPAIWWLLGQIQLTREQTVDREVIDITAAREQYIDALLAVAGACVQLDLAPAPLFLKKSHLSQRVALILKEASMSKQRLLSSLAAIGGALLITARLAVLSFPINAPAQQVVKGDAGLLHRAPIEYPAEAIEKGLQGTVLVEATLNDRGVVTDARVLSGLEPLRKAALKSVLEWHYSLQVPSPVQVAIDFTLPPKRSGVAGGVAGGVVGGVPGGVIGGVIGGAPGGVRPTSPSIYTPSGPLRLGSIKLRGVPPQLLDALKARIPYRVGDELGPDAASRLKQALREIDEHLEFSLTVSHNDGVEQSQDAALTIFFTAPVESPAGASGPQRLRIGGNVQAAMVINYIKPVYPPLAKQARIQGTVRFNVVINKDGTIQDIQVESGHPLLAEAALDAVRQWTYKPTLLNGEPVEVATVVDVNFTLSQ
jgi:TonB family protein